MKVRFEKVSIRGTRLFKDARGRTRRQAKTFCQTINPLNVDQNGRKKSREQIVRELEDEMRNWIDAKPPSEET